MRRALTLQAYWKDGDLVLENFATRIAVSAEPVTIDILNFFDRWRHRESLAAEMPQFGAASVHKAVKGLIKYSLLVEEGSPEAELGESIARTWRHWLPHGSYHFATKDAPFASPRQWARMAREFRAVAPQPALTKSYPRVPTRLLPGASSDRDQFLRVLLDRKTHREFSKAPLPLDKLATLLHYTWGAMGVIQSPNFGPLLHKTSPSGGARHPSEVYVAALRVKGLPRGIYHYNLRRHALELVKKGPVQRQVLSWALGQAHVGNACAVCFMTASFPRSMYNTGRRAPIGLSRSKPVTLRRRSAWWRRGSALRRSRRQRSRTPRSNGRSVWTVSANR